MEHRFVVRQGIYEKDLTDLIDGTVLGIRVPNYIDKEVRSHLLRAIASYGKAAPYLHEESSNGEIISHYFGVDRIGIAFNSTYSHERDSQVTQNYYAQAIDNLNFIRSLSKPYTHPVDQLRLHLDETYQHGALLARFEEEPMTSGIVRITHATHSTLDGGEPHFDALPLRFKELSQQLAANIYLQMPEQGGELEVWDIPSLSPLSEIPQKWRAVLPQPYTVQPKSGDLIIFNCRKPHCVQPFQGDPRISMQLFIGVAKGEPLYVWN